MKYFFLMVFSVNSYSQTHFTQLQDASQRINKDLPEIYDHSTKLIKTTVENNNFYYHFILRADQGEFNWALPKVRQEILKTICTKPRERMILNYKANIVYRYENDKGQSLGEFMVKPEHCHTK